MRKWGSIYARGRWLWLAYADADGTRVYKPSGFKVGEEAKAAELLGRIERQIRAAVRFGVERSDGPITVQSFAEKWLGQRTHLVSHRIDSGRMKHHVWPRIGTLELREVRTRHVVELVRALRADDRKFSARTVHGVYGLLHTMFRAAQLEELVQANPCVLGKDQLGKKVDKNPEWRARAVFTRDELELLISSDEVPLERRMLVALAGLAGLRYGEVVGLRWRNYDPEARPLGRLVIAHSHDREGTKTGVTREVPVHPTLAAMLASWRLTGWAEMLGRHPTADDLVVPYPDGEMYPHRRAYRRFQTDLVKLGLRARRFHDLRRTFITLARADGARPDLLKMVTHGPSGNVFDLYTSMPWAPLCEEVGKLNVERRMGELIPMPLVAQLGERTRPGVTLPVTISRKATAATVRRVSAEGIEPST